MNWGVGNFWSSQAPQVSTSFTILSCYILQISWCTIFIADERAKPLLVVQVAKAKLYEAKVGLVEAQIRAERTRGESETTFIE